MKTQEFVRKAGRHIVWRLNQVGALNRMPDEKYLQMMFYLELGKHLDLENPKSFNEKLQWLKLNDRKDIYTKLVDKYEVKRYIADALGEEYIIPTIGDWEHFEDIDFQQLPEQFVLKCSHDSGGLVICRDKGSLDIEKAKLKLTRSLKNNYYYHGREWPYKNVKPRIIAEKLLVDNNDDDLRDYKFFCFNGKVKCFKIDFDRFLEHHANYYDRDCCLLPFGELQFYPKPEKQLEMPSKLEEMICLAEKLANGFPFLRVDFYEVDNRIFFGELTLFPASGFGEFTPSEWDIELGDWLTIS